MWEMRIGIEGSGYIEGVQIWIQEDPFVWILLSPVQPRSEIRQMQQSSQFVDQGVRPFSIVIIASRVRPYDSDCLF